MSGETAIEERPGAVEWASLKPGDLAWDAGDGDLVVAWRDDKEVGGYAPLLLVHPGGRMRWHNVDGADAGLNDVNGEGQPPEFRANNQPIAPLAVVLASSVPHDSPEAVARIAAAQADAAREVARRALVALLGEGSP